MENVDEVSGNVIPPGSAPEEVRDDIPIKASAGEYMLPADVVKYFGLDYIEKLITKAKTGMEELQANGRIGGQGPDDLPFSPEELQAHEDEMTEEAPMEMAVGGFISPLKNKVSAPVASSVVTQPGSSVSPQSTTVPTWMQDTPEKSSAISNNEGAGKTAETQAKGFGRAVKDWETKDYSDYAAAKDSPVRSVADKIFSTVSPLAGMAIKAATNYTDKTALGRMKEMLSSGVGPNGQPLTTEEKQSLTDASSKLSEKKSSVQSGLGGLLGNLVDKALSPKKEEKAPEKKEAEKSSGGERDKDKNSSSGNNAGDKDKTGGRSMAKGGLVTRR